MKEYIETVNWSEIWGFSKHFILPNMGWFVFWAALFIVLGFIVGIVLSVYLYKKQIFTRDKKYYNWIAKLWIPYIVIVCLYFFSLFGMFYGGHSILSKESKNITAGIYSNTLGSAFSSEKEKRAFLSSLQQLSNSSEDASKSMTKALALYIQKNNTGMASIDSLKNSSGNYLLKEYESEIYSASVYGFMKVVDSKADMSNTKDISYAEFKSLLQQLDKIEPQKIEQSIQFEMGHKLQSFLDYIFKDLIKQQLFLFLLFLSFPFIEFLIYWKFLKTKSLP